MPLSSLRRPALILALGAVVGFAGYGAYRLQIAHRPATHSAPGVVHETEIQLASEIGGRLDSLLVAPGARVSKGDVLAVVSNPALLASLDEAKAAVAKAEADRAHVYAGTRQEDIDIAAGNVEIAESNLRLAQQQHARAETLSSKSFLSQQKLEEATAALGKAQANLAVQRAAHRRSLAGPTAQERANADAKVTLAEATVARIAAKLGKTTLAAPIDGGVRLIVGAPGEVVSAGQAILTLEAGHERWFSFTLREDLLGDLGVGSPVWLRDARGSRIEARVTELRPLGEFATWRAARAVGDHDLNSFFLRADPVADTAALEPGMTVWLDRDATR